MSTLMSIHSSPIVSEIHIRNKGYSKKKISSVSSLGSKNQTTKNIACKKKNNHLSTLDKWLFFNDFQWDASVSEKATRNPKPIKIAPVTQFKYACILSFFKIKKRSFSATTA